MFLNWLLEFSSSHSTFRTLRISIGTNYWDVETYRNKLEKKVSYFDTDASIINTSVKSSALQNSKLKTKSTFLVAPKYPM